MCEKIINVLQNCLNLQLQVRSSRFHLNLKIKKLTRNRNLLINYIDVFFLTTLCCVKTHLV